MTKNGVWNLLKELDRVAATTVFNGPRAAAERTVRELQKKGPSWTGRFSNSWQIEGPSGVGSSKGDGQPGDPRPIYSPLVSGQQVTKSLLTKDKLIFTISNFSDHALKAIDAVEQANVLYPRGWDINPDGPSTQLGKSKFEPELTGREGNSSYRGAIGGGDPNSFSSRTAPLHWFSTFVEGGALDKAVQRGLDSMLNKAFK
jgi:hypothetical protein